ncbi:carbohydrate-binding protein [Paenibacillus swuensis]|uniref:Carbohydrate-binding protein n=1 Tax=Paenibacillus swuensis TaxID=1178515 RepID=A0A172TP23_9BACL|nr:carbohydrate-binding protein [Paenibacillus swuensis]
MQTQTGTTQPGTRKFVSYASSWNTSIYDLTTANIPNYITDINLAFARPDTAYVKGSYAFDQAVAGFEFVEGKTGSTGQKKFTAQQAQDLRGNIAALKSRGTGVWVSVGGWDYSQGSQWSSFSAPRVVDLALDLGATGVDIDWESSTSNCNKLTADQFSCTKDGEIGGIINSLYNEIKARGASLKISIAGWSTGAYYVKGTPFEEGKVQWGSPFGGTMYSLVKNHGGKIDMINLMSYDAGDYYDPREGYESYRAIYNGPINMGMEIAPEGSGGAILELLAPAGTVYDADMLTGQNNVASPYYNVETMVKYMKNKARPSDGFMMWQLWKQRVHQPAPAGAATENSAGQYVCNNLPLAGSCAQTIPTLPKL